jgi:hypothetical protein
MQSFPASKQDWVCNGEKSSQCYVLILLLSIFQTAPNHTTSSTPEVVFACPLLGSENRVGVVPQLQSPPADGAAPGWNILQACHLACLSQEFRQDSGQSLGCSILVVNLEVMHLAG